MFYLVRDCRDIMTDSVSTLYISFSAVANDPLHWWHVRDGILISRGLDQDPLIAAECNLPIIDDRAMTIVALVPSRSVVVQWHNRISDITEKQAKAAALIAARKVSLQPQICHVASVADNCGQIVTATMDQQLLTDGLADLNVRGIDPDIVTPSGWLVPPNDDGALAIDFGFDQLLRTKHMIAPDEPDFRQYFLDSVALEPVDEDEIGRILSNAETSAPLNLRSGDFVKRSNNRISAQQKKSLTWLAVAVIIASLAISFAQWARYQWAATSADDQVRAALLPIIGEVADLDEGERLLDQELIAENRGNVIFSVPASALFAAIQRTPGVSVGRLSYRQDGLIAAELSALRNEEINPALIALQKAGFKVTATPRTDATGSAKADITLRAP